MDRKYKHHTVSYVDNKMKIDIVNKNINEYALLLDKISAQIKINLRLNINYSLEHMDYFHEKIESIIEDHILEHGSANRFNKTRSHNYKIYSELVKSFGLTNEHDIKFISNKFGKVYSKYDCIDNYRVCLSDKQMLKSDDYLNIVSNGCCGFYDKHIYNPLTGNYYFIGFNYGH